MENPKEIESWAEMDGLKQRIRELEDDQSQLEEENKRLKDEVIESEESNKELQQRVKELERELHNLRKIGQPATTTQGKRRRALQSWIDKTFTPPEKIDSPEDPASVEFECSKCPEPALSDTCRLEALKNLRPVSVMDRARVYATNASNLPLSRKLALAWSGKLPQDVKIDSAALKRATEDAIHCCHRAMRFGGIPKQAMIQHHTVKGMEGDPSVMIRNMMKILEGQELKDPKVLVIAAKDYAPLFRSQTTIDFQEAETVESVLFKLLERDPVDNVTIVMPMQESYDDKVLGELEDWLKRNATKTTILSGMVKDSADEFARMAKAIKTVSRNASAFIVTVPGDMVGTKTLASIAYLPKNGNPPSLPFLQSWYDGCRKLIEGLPPITHTHRIPKRALIKNTENHQPKRTRL